MEILEQLGVALGFATLAGINLYLTTFIAGLAIRFDWLSLASKYEQLEVLADPWIIGVSGVLFAIEFFADKIPWVDSTWDVLHTIVRPVGGVLLALAALGQLDPTVSVIAALLAGGTSLTTHLAKAGGRLFLNLSPEPVSNMTASVAEDGVVLGGLGLMAFAPIPALFVFFIIVLIAGWIVWKTSALIQKAWRKFRRKPALEA
ncbi:DUF4126 domain-containing protein [Roseibacillus persicicus]|uniref:DUF4126 domain-containing protein n=1 Tax=Roseibacillus persicicus TaxID=454148 RepID=UPI00398B8622